MDKKSAKALREEILAKVATYYELKHKKGDFIPGITRILHAGRVFDEKDMVNLVDASLDFWLTMGRYAEEFEYRFAEYIGVSNAILVNSGSSANLVALTALTSPKLGEKALKPGDEVITVAAGFATTVSPILQNGLIPVFVDVSLGNYNAVPEQLEEAIGPKTRAIMLAHILGNPFDLDAVLGLVNKYDLWLIEDNCDAVGSTYRDKITGGFGHLATTAHFPAHHITMGEGGCVLTSNDKLASIARSLRDWGRDCYCSPGKNDSCGKRFTQQFGTLPYGYDHKYVYSHLGYNLKVTDMQAAVGVAQLEKIDYFIERRRSNFTRIYNGLKKFSDRLILPTATQNSEPSWFTFPISVKDDAGFSRDDLTSFLESKCVDCRNFFGGNLTRHPAYLNKPMRKLNDLPNSDYIMDNTFFIGVYPGIGEQEIDYVVDNFRKFMESH